LSHDGDNRPANRSRLNYGLLLEEFDISKSLIRFHLDISVLQRRPFQFKFLVSKCPEFVPDDVFAKRAGAVYCGMLAVVRPN